MIDDVEENFGIQLRMQSRMKVLSKKLHMKVGRDKVAYNNEGWLAPWINHDGLEIKEDGRDHRNCSNSWINQVNYLDDTNDVFLEVRGL